MSEIETIDLSRQNYNFMGAADRKNCGTAPAGDPPDLVYDFSLASEMNMPSTSHNWNGAAASVSPLASEVSHSFDVVWINIEFR